MRDIAVVISNVGAALVCVEREKSAASSMCVCVQSTIKCFYAPINTRLYTRRLRVLTADEVFSVADQGFLFADQVFLVANQRRAKTKTDDR